MILSGRVVTGIGEGSYYMSQTHYIREFEKEVGFTPYPGTLDIRLERDSAWLKDTLTRLPSKEVPGFETKERAFGPVKFFPAKLRKLEVAIVLPLRSHHTDILEIIAPKNLRRAFGLKDGDPVQVEVVV
jgi:riboflavin kinase